jgi:hypothetical protein
LTKRAGSGSGSAPKCHGSGTLVKTHVHTVPRYSALCKHKCVSPRTVFTIWFVYNIDKKKTHPHTYRNEKQYLVFTNVERLNLEYPFAVIVDPEFI